MTRPPLVSMWVMAALCGTGPLVAADATPVLQEPAPASPAPTPTRPRVISPAVAAQLAAAVPKLTAAPAPAKADAATDLRETDKPRNTIIRLPSYVVTDERPPVFKERELLTPRGRLDVALKKFPGLRFGSFWIFRNDGIALAMLEEEEQIERKKEMMDLLSLLPAAETKRAKAAVDDAFMRR